MWFISKTFYSSLMSVSSAISLDGVRWYADMKNPVAPGGGDTAFDMNMWTPRVLADSGGYRMYYMASNSSGVFTIGLATSADGTAWTKYAYNPLLTNGPTGSWDETGALTHSVLRVDSLYYMWYSGASKTGHTAFGLATSADGVHWTKYPGNPVFQQDTSAWEAGEIGGPAVVRVGNTFYMYYLGASDAVCCHGSAGMAYSSDGIHWTRSASNPVLTPSSGWDDQAIGTLDAIVHDQKIYLYYSAQSSITLSWESGLATSDLTTLGVKAVQQGMPEKSSLFQSYPNPFNPTATIHFQIQQACDVSLKIYDMLGREIATLISDRRPAGTYDVVWNGEGCASGVYMYRLVAGGYHDSKKMVLVK